jgi:hypothetical protein
MKVLVTEPDQIIISCLHDPFPLVCPLCGGHRWEQDGRDAKCRECGLEVHIIQDPKRCRLILEVQGA